MSEETQTEETKEAAPVPEAAAAPEVAAAPAAAATTDGTDEGRRHSKERIGVVVKANAAKTVVVQVTRRVQHPRYSKYINRRARYSAHDEIGVNVGDYVRIRETRPLSKTKRWRVVGTANKQS